MPEAAPAPAPGPSGAPIVDVAKKAAASFNAGKEKVGGHLDAAAKKIADSMEVDLGEFEKMSGWGILYNVFLKRPAVNIYKSVAPMIGGVMASTRMALNMLLSPFKSMRSPIKKVAAPAAAAHTGNTAGLTNAAATPFRTVDDIAEGTKELTSRWGPTKIISWIFGKVAKVTGFIKWTPDKVADLTHRAYKATSNYAFA
ncbi:hypothetical protein HY604_02980 [Candidatus Peregrinibacteria bacterium]|nr:hypothetical protein [Candidatus Peregrinibacteria bacterium]